ncbi:Non-specific serine/threonine protein kinase [Bertholletia excelsa]
MLSSRLFYANSNPTVLFLVITTFSSILLVFSLFYLVYYLCTLVRQSRPIPLASPQSKLQRFSYKDLKSATGNFHPANSIGKGGSGTVFRGILGNGKLVAVKMLDSSSFKADREFQNEIRALGSVKSPFIVSLLGYCLEKRRRLLVYEYMPNRSLQESLFSEYSDLNWEKRFEIILDVSRALAYLHFECDPPIVHGDVKPSNVLLDSEYRAKLSDFGLSRVKIADGIDLFKSDNMWKSQVLTGYSTVVREVSPERGTPLRSRNEVAFSLPSLASSSLESSDVRALDLNSFICNENTVDENDGSSSITKSKEVLTHDNGGEDWSKIVIYDDKIYSTDHGKELNLRAASMVVDDTRTGAEQMGRDWWWKQDGNNNLGSKGYVMEWIDNQICPSTTHEITNLDNLTGIGKVDMENKIGYSKKGSETEDLRGWKPPDKPRKMQEWWKEEHLDEVSKRTGKLKKLATKYKKQSRMLPFYLVPKPCWSQRQRKFGKQKQNEGDPNTEFSFRKGWQNRNLSSVGSEIWSGELSSKISTRGTLCYVAPECGGCGYLMEKGDIYSLGVLILVMVSGRRPLHVLSSPMKLEKANLVSWCRHLAQSGTVLQLVDERLKDEYNKEQVSLCINLALACLQKMPELRPDTREIIKILIGEVDLPPNPFEFSPSPPSKLFTRHRRKQKDIAN